MAGVLPLWSLMAWLEFIPAVLNVRIAAGYFKGGSASIASLDEATARLQLFFSLVLTVSFVLAGLVG